MNPLCRIPGCTTRVKKRNGVLQDVCRRHRMGLAPERHRHAMRDRERRKRLREREVNARLLARENATGMRCRYHVAEELVPQRQTRRVFAGTSPTGYSRQRLVLKCPIAACPFVAALPGEAAEESDAA